jgi:hypothetical protein
MKTIGGESTWRLYLMSGVLIQYCIPLLIITFCHFHMAQVLWGTKTPGQAYDQRDKVILANKRKVRKGGLISEIFSLWLKSQIKVPDHSPEQGRGKERQKVEFQATEMTLYASFDMIGRY